MDYIFTLHTLHFCIYIFTFDFWSVSALFLETMEFNPTEVTNLWFSYYVLRYN